MLSSPVQTFSKPPYTGECILTMYFNSVLQSVAKPVYVAVSHTNEVTRLSKFPLHLVLCQISLNKVGFYTEMVVLYIKNPFEHNNAVWMKHNSVQKLTNHFFGIAHIYTNSPATTSNPFSLKKIQ